MTPSSSLWRRGKYPDVPAMKGHGRADSRRAARWSGMTQCSGLIVCQSLGFWVPYVGLEPCLLGMEPRPISQLSHVPRAVGAGWH